MKIEQIAFERGYRVTEKGIFLNPSKKEIGSINSNGYVYTTIRISGKNTKLKSHRLQAYQKHGDKIFEDDIVVRHVNNIKSDNSSKNIKIGTQSDNMLDIPKELRLVKSIHASSFMKKYDKNEIQNFHSINKSYKETMEKFNISSKGTLNYILRN
jgi:hypothetical protein